MKIFRFDPEVSMPVTEPGSSFKIKSLTAPDSRAQVQVMHLEPGGRVARNEVAVRHLVAVMAGTGWASDGEGRRQDLWPGRAAVWEQGEIQELGTDSGFTAVSVEGTFEVWAAAVTRDIVVCDYDSEWPRWFEEVREYVWPAVKDTAVGVDHVGSTAVPGLAAKPIIDMDVVVTSPEDIGPVIERLGQIGYRWLGDLGITGREAFSPPEAADLPPHNLYLVVEDNRAHVDHWLLRDLLRADPEARSSYEALKRLNVALAEGDMDVYVARKAALVAELLTREREGRGLPAVSYWVPDIDDSPCS